jgi:hypothetical protein
MKVTVKKAIQPIAITLNVTATKINENGTFSGLIIEKISGPKGTKLGAVAPPQGGGSIYLKSSTLDGIVLLDDDDGPKSIVKKKLF